MVSIDLIWNWIWCEGFIWFINQYIQAIFGRYCGFVLEGGLNVTFEASLNIAQLIKH